jgi:4-alpha-glucanotransferase
VPDEKYNKFVLENENWLSEYALFVSIKNSLGGIPWTEWPKELRLRDEKALAEKREELSEEIAFCYFLQFEFSPSGKNSVPTQTEKE